MAKKRAKARPSRKRSGRSGGSALQQASFVGEGLRALSAWVGTLVIGGFSLLRWASVRLWASLRGDRARQPLGMLLAAASLFTFVALLDFRSGALYDNLCGIWGYKLAEWMLRFSGVAAFIAPAFGVFWGVAVLLRPEHPRAPGKWIGVAVLTLVVAGVAAGLSPSPLPDGSFPHGRGGWFGHTVFPPLQSAFGAFGVSVLLMLLGAVASLFATEWAFVPLIRELTKGARQAPVQRDLPMAGGARPFAEEHADNRVRAARGLRRLWNGIVGASQPYVPEAEATPVAPSVASPTRIPTTIGGRPAEATPPEATTTESPLNPPPATEAAPVEKGKAQTKPVAVPSSLAESTPNAATESATPLPPATSSAENEEDYSLPGISDGPELTQRPAAPEPTPPPKKPRARPRLDSLPPVTILAQSKPVDRGQMQSEIDSLGQRLQACFDAFGLDAQVVGAERGPTLTLFEVRLAAGVSVKKLKNQRDDLAVQLGSHGVRIVYPLPGRTTVGIEVPNLNRESVYLKDVFDDAKKIVQNSRLPMIIGRDTLGKPVVEDLTVMPHMLVAGTTGSGKSVCLNSILTSMLLNLGPDRLRLILVDPKQVELQLYRDIPHLACPVVTDMKRAPFVLEWAVRAMEDRLHLFKLAGVRDIHAYNSLGRKELQNRLEENWEEDETPDTLPFLVLVIDELADLMMVSAKEVEIAISRLAAKARAAGIHLLVATQRPSTDVVTGLIKMNLPVRIAFKVTSSVDSRVILDDSGADMLLGNGDFLYRPPGAAGMSRGQGAFVGEKEVRAICDHLRKHGKPEFIEDLIQEKGSASTSEVDDPLYEDAVRIILQSGRGSASLLQRALSIGYTRASRLIDIMSEQGVLGPFIGSKAREVQLTVEEWEDQLSAKA